MAELQKQSASERLQSVRPSYRKRSRIFNKIRKNYYRSFRRHRSKTKYYNRLKELRIQRKSEQLCDTFHQLNNVADFDMMEAQHFGDSTREVAEWHQQEQVAYWKSRALTLEIENRMLHMHIRNFHLKRVQEYEDYARQLQEGKIINGVSGVNDHHHQQQQNQYHENQQQEQQEQDESKEKYERFEPPKVLESAMKAREEKRRLYGEMAPQIIGMETAVQLNYDKHLRRSEVKHWPNIAFRL